MTNDMKRIINNTKQLLPRKADITFKGSLGRHLALTGSSRFPGAAGFPSLAALKMGVDLPYLLLSPDRDLLLLTRMKSSDFMVSPLPSIDYTNISHKQSFKQHSSNKDAIVFGPGLSRINDPMYEHDLEAKTLFKNSVVCQLKIIADSLSNESHKIPIGKDRLILTPNEREFKHLNDAIPLIFDEIHEDHQLMVLVKGDSDKIGHLSEKGFSVILKCDYEGGLKRCGGLGDCLTGVISTILAWIEIKQRSKDAETTAHDYINAVMTGCCIMREASKQAYNKHGISCVAENVIDEIPNARDIVLGDFINE
ncbi:unnamed protein product [Hanseniaspora opuntiae]